MQNADNRLERKGLARKGQKAEGDAGSPIHGVKGEEEEKNRKNQRTPEDGSGDVAVFKSRCQAWVVSPGA